VKVYQTRDMEAAVRRMIELDDKAIIFKKYWCRRRIKFRAELIPDVAITTTSAISPYYDRQLQKWNRKKGVLMYSPNLVIDKLPSAPSMLFVEAPLSYRYFEKYIDRTTRSVVVYRPPNWDFQEEKLNFKLPRSADLTAVLTAANTLRAYPLKPVELRALNVSGFNTGTAFSGDTIESITGLKYSQTRKLFARGFSGYFRWYQPYTLLVEPEEDWLLDTYRALEDQLQLGLLRNDKFEGNLQALRLLLRQGCVRREPPVYVLRDGHIAPDYGMMDALNNARRGDWFKMRSIVEHAPEYEC
jgi:hypothetical protein